MKGQVDALRNIVRERRGRAHRRQTARGALSRGGDERGRRVRDRAGGVERFEEPRPRLVSPDRSSSTPGARWGSPSRRKGSWIADTKPTARSFRAELPGPSSRIRKPQPAARVSFVFDRRTIARNGESVPLAVDTLCVHGDTPNAAAIAAEVRAALVEAEIVVRSLKGWRPPAPGSEGSSARL